MSRATLASTGDATADEAAVEEAATEPAPQRRPLFAMPNVREDIRALPGMFRERRRLWIPFVLLLAGFALAYPLYTGALTGDAGAFAGMFVNFFFLPQSLFTFFLGGFLAPRASYLVGFVLGVVNAALWAVLLLLLGVRMTDEVDAVVVAVNLFVIAVVFGTLAAAFAAWYRNFLRGSQERARRNQALRAQQARAKAREAERAERAERARQRQSRGQTRTTASGGTTGTS